MPIQPGTERIGRSVYYSATHCQERSEDEHGHVVRWNDTYVFVKFDGDAHAKACRRADLYWEGE